jgi:predicted glycosyltransferase involved in capsule biosynthesis
MQNVLGGGSIAITRAAYLAIGGMDEGFVGWGGEDNEFWERAQTLRVWSYGCLPYVHLWHPSQPRKYDSANPTLIRYQSLTAIDPHKRIELLVSSNSGGFTGPAA